MKDFNDLMRDHYRLMAEFQELINELHNKQQGFADYNTRARERLSEMSSSIPANVLPPSLIMQVSAFHSTGGEENLH